jgi:hypothetical protein
LVLVALARHQVRLEALLDQIPSFRQLLQQEAAEAEVMMQAHRLAAMAALAAVEQFILRPEEPEHLAKEMLAVLVRIMLVQAVAVAVVLVLLV